ncbi:NAD(P)-dependent oxidoreductase [Neptunitalea lumnitzerae]|uniref:3-hydroxyisobutyrate dehydrogenase n=1 Tax=Neptunitalea lumnitzerae TaxID=2965509 RepID=A0ABQ5MM31_9FLAO|nr:NAD(P)-dependent oxidoreductase [Neptunitalea sp. Y10]GLB50447.1 3-hydroxyisobutyrate dehydrogenase [Neptunitalea sp. Y10]
MKVGFIGLGIMGSRMAMNLLKGGHKLVIFNRTKEKAIDLIKAGAIWEDSAVAVAGQVDVLITMLENPAVVEKMAVGESGFIKAMKDKAIWIDCSTVNPSFSVMLSELATLRNVSFLDAPVSGSKMPAEKGELIFLVGGNVDDLEKVTPLLDLMGSKIIHVGDHGKGAAMKLMINQMLGQSMLAFSESLSLGMAMGLDKTQAMDVLLESAVSAPILKAFRARIEDEDYTPNFPLKHLQKDLQLFTDTAYELDKATPLTNTAKEVYAMAKQQGMADLDFAAVFKLLST